MTGRGTFATRCEANKPKPLKGEEEMSTVQNAHGYRAVAAQKQARRAQQVERNLEGMVSADTGRREMNDDLGGQNHACAEPEKGIAMGNAIGSDVLAAAERNLNIEFFPKHEKQQTRNSAPKATPVCSKHHKVQRRSDCARGHVDRIGGPRRSE